MKTKLLIAALSCAATIGMTAGASAAPTVTEFPLPTADAGAQDIVMGPDNTIWFTERSLSKIGRIDPSDPSDIDEFPTKNAGASPDIIIVGPDNKIWFTEQGGNSIGRIDPANPDAPDSFGGLGLQDPRGIAVGPDGNLWVADADAASPEVVIVSPAGAKVDDVALPAAFNARNIARGADGNMWVAGFSSSAIARIVTSPTPTLDPAAGYPVPDGATPIDVIAGNDGNIWYAAQGTVVGKMTPGGVATNYTSKGVDPFGITLGPDGAVWYAEFQAPAIGRVGYDGTTSHVTGLAANAGPRYVTSGPGNTLWFTEETGNRVGRVSGIEIPQSPPPPPPPPPPEDTTAPDVTALSLARKRFRLGSALPTVAAVKTGTTIRFSVSEAATARFTFKRALPGRRVSGKCRKPTRRNRGRKRCTRWVTVRGAAISRPVEAGARKLRFSGRISRRKSLKPGRYELTLRARDAAGNVSSPDRAKFTLLPKAQRKRRA